MVLAKQEIPIALSDGLDLKTDPKQLSPGKFLTVENGTFLKTGEIRKVNGYADKVANFNMESYGDTSSGCATLKDSLFVTGQKNAYSYSLDRDLLTKVGEYLPVSVKRSLLISSQGYIDDEYMSYVAYDSGTKIFVIVWSEKDYVASSGNRVVKFIAIDETGGIVQKEQIVDTGGRCKVVTNSGMDYFLILYEKESVNQIWAAGYTKNSLVVGSKQQVGSSSNLVPNSIDLYADETLAKPYAAWGSGVGSPDTTVANFPADFATFSTVGSYVSTTVANLSSIYGVYIIGIGGNIQVTGATDTPSLAIKTVGLNAALTSTVSALTTLTTAGGENVVVSYDDADATLLHIFYNRSLGGSVGSTDNVYRITYKPSTTTITRSAHPFARNSQIAGSPIYDYSNIYKKYYLPIATNQSSSQIQSYYLVRIPNNAEYSDTVGYLSYVAAKFLDDGARQSFPGEYYKFIRGPNNIFYSMVRDSNRNYILYNVDFRHTPCFAELANNLHVTGGYLGMYDGFEFAEHNFFMSPPPPKLTSAAGAIAAGTYYYSITYVWIDGAGQVHESAPSDPVFITTAIASNITLKCPPLGLTNKKTNVYLLIYRSSDGVNFYRVQSNLDYLFTPNTINTDSITFVDNRASINSNPLLYTSGGVLANGKAPACTYITNYKRRLMLVPLEDQNSVWYSKEIIASSIGAVGTPVEWASEFILSVDERGGSINGIIQLDDKLVIGKANTISILVGDGPNDAGTQNDFSTPQILAVDAGFEEGNSLVIFPGGLLFKSPKGYYLLDRSLSASYIGAPVEDYNVYKCRSAVLLYDRNEVWFSNTQNTIIYNYFFNQWTTATFSWLQACNFQKKYTGVLGNKLIQETPGTYTRNGVGYAMKLQTGWISFANVQGFQRIYKLLILGSYKTNHIIRADFSYDFVDTPTQTTSISVTAPTGNVLQYRVFLSRQKCESLKITLQDLSLSGVYAESWTISNLAFEVGAKKGLNKLPATNSKG